MKTLTYNTLIVLALLCLNHSTNAQTKISAEADQIILGSDVVPPSGSALYFDTLLFFDREKSALRFGNISQVHFWQPEKIGFGSFAWGRATEASGVYSYSGGENSHVSGYFSFGFGFANEITSSHSTSFGQQNHNFGKHSFTQGLQNEARADHAIAMGELSIVDGEGGIGLGQLNQVNGINAAAIGNNIIGNAQSSLTVGQFNVADGFPDQWSSRDPLFAVGNGTNVNDRSNALTVFKNGTLIVNRWNIPEEGSTITENMMFFNTENGAFRAGRLSLSDSWQTSLLGSGSAAFGQNSIASGNFSISVGLDSKASGYLSQSFGSGTEASGTASFSAGAFSNARGNYSFSFGRLSNANADYSLAFGEFNNADGLRSIVFGEGNTTSAHYGVLMGLGLNVRSMHVNAFGKYNALTTNNPDSWTANEPLFILGNGTSDLDRSNALTVLKNGSLVVNYEKLPGATQTFNDPVLFFDTEKYAFRAGRVTGTQWSQNDIGFGSFAVGWDTKASGSNALATGFQTQATGLSSTALGQMTGATNDYSTATGKSTIANGKHSFSAGEETRAYSSHSFVLGRFNIEDFSENQDTWEADESLFVIGNGTADNARNNAVTILKNGNTGLGTTGPESTLDVRGTTLVKMNSNGTESHLTLEETADDFARLDFKNTTTTDRWTIAARPQAIAADARFNVFLENVGNVMVVTGDEKVGIARTPLHPLHVGTDASNGNGAHVTAGGTWTNGSSRTFKENFQPINTAEILNALMKLDIQKWEYKGSDEGFHLGPIAEEFHEAFGLGNDEKYISTVDIEGVALAAIQALNEQNILLKSENEELRKRLEKLEKIIFKGKE